MARIRTATGPAGLSRRSAAEHALPASRVEAPARDDIDIWGLPRGQHKLDAAQIEASQHARACYGLVHSVAAKGYAATTVADICRLAHLSKSTFYKLFDDKEAAFLAAYDIAHDELVSTVVHSQSFDSGWAQRMRDTLRAYLLYNRENPAVARAFLVEIHAVGARAWARRDWGHEIFARMQQALYAVRREEDPTLPDLPEEIFLAVVAALEEMVCAYVRRDHDDRVLELLPRALFLVEAVYSGNPAAFAALRSG